MNSSNKLRSVNLPVYQRFDWGRSTLGVPLSSDVIRSIFLETSVCSKIQAIPHICNSSRVDSRNRRINQQFNVCLMMHYSAEDRFSGERLVVKFNELQSYSVRVLLILIPDGSFMTHVCNESTGRATQSQWGVRCKRPPQLSCSNGNEGGRY